MMNIFLTIPALGVAIILVWMFAVLQSISREWSLLQYRLREFFDTETSDID
jgi:hypothetical protein